MPYAPLAVVKNRIRPGVPLPFNVRDGDGTLLLAAGLVLPHDGQVARLLQRAALVDLSEVRLRAADVQDAARDELPALWSACTSRIGQALLETSAPTFRQALDEAAEPVAALVARDPDLAIFEVLRQEGKAQTRYGLDHSVHTAIIARLVAQRLGWDDASMTMVFKASLTMNLAMLELQGVLAEQLEPPTEEQRLQIHEHPQRSVAMLELAGVADPVWLRAVAQHHEVEDGSGYPTRTRDVSEAASLIRRADLYAAKLTPRASREARMADQAGREIFMQDPGHPMTAALVKEFGVYPPGCFVQLVSGEIGMVVKRGPTVTTPVVTVMSSARGVPLAQPERRDTSRPQCAIARIVHPRSLTQRPSKAELAALVCA
jgi:HD-GYP domain-containing protein (c-di-GMP phosphodiesterase class II)